MTLEDLPKSQQEEIQKFVEALKLARAIQVLRKGNPDDEEPEGRDKKH